MKSLAFLSLLAMPVAKLAWGAKPAVRRYGSMYLVNGWLLTAQDLKALDRYDV